MDDPATGILEATHWALCRYGYADLTLRNVADEAALSGASINYHDDEAIRSRLAGFDAFRRRRVRDIVELGVEAGEIVDCIDPAAASELRVTTVAGAHSRPVVIERSTGELREALARGAERHLTGGEPPAAPEATR